MSETGKEKQRTENNARQRVQRLWLVRHGATQWNQEQRLCGHRDVALSSTGRSQAQWTARYFRSSAIATIYTSDLLRAQQTARYIARQQVNTVPIEVLPAWREMFFGDWEGLTYSQIASQYEQDLAFFSDPLHHSPPHGEPFLSLVQRVQSAFVELAQSVPTNAGDMILVSHGGPLRVLLCHLLGIPFERQWQLHIEHGSISALDFIPGTDTATNSVTLVAFNIQRVPRQKAPRNPISSALQIESALPHA